MSTPAATFARIAPPWMDLLMKDFPMLGILDACAVFGNAGHECNGFTTLQEVKPVVPGSRGGWGWMQWTGPRRRAFEAYAARHGYDLRAAETNYKWLFIELMGPEGERVIPRMVAAKTLPEKTRVFSDTFLRPGIPHMTSRVEWANRALEAWERWREAGEPGRLTPEAPDARPDAPVAETGPFGDVTLDTVLQLAERPAAELDRAARAIALARAAQAGWRIAAPGAALSLTGGQAAAPVSQPEKEDMTMNGNKRWFQSRGVLGGIGAIAALIGPIFGLDLGEANVNEATIAINDLVAAIGALIAVWGRMSATRKITR